MLGEFRPAFEQDVNLSFTIEASFADDVQRAAKLPADRFQSIQEVADALAPHVAGSSMSFQSLRNTASWKIAPATVREFPPRSPRSPRLPWVLSGLLSAAVLFLVQLHRGLHGGPVGDPGQPAVLRHLEEVDRVCREHRLSAAAARLARPPLATDYWDRTALELLRPGGLLLLVLYPGHEGGAEEAQALRDLASGLPPRQWQVTEYRTLNARQAPPSVLAVEKAGMEAVPDWEI